MHIAKPDESLWVEKYRPIHIDDIILDDKAPFQKMIDNKDIPHLIFHGSAGLGKTTLAKLLCKQIGLDYIFINASLESSIDTLRDKISHFARTVSMVEDVKKVVIMDEADGVTSNAFFTALRPMLEEYSSNCTFIFTLNYFEKIPDPIVSRCQVYNFTIADNKKHASKILKRVVEILENEKVEYDKEIIANIIRTNFPDIRKIIQLCDQHKDSLTDPKLKYRLLGGDIENLIVAMKEKNFEKMKEFVVKELTFTDGIYRQLYDRLRDFLEPSSIPPAILYLDEYMRTHNFVIDKEIHVISFLLTFANEVKFK